MKESEDNVLKTWVEESPHPYENDSCITKVNSNCFCLVIAIPGLSFEAQDSGLRNL